MSDSGSGDIDSASELSRLRGNDNELELVCACFDRCTSSSRSLTSLGGMTDESVAFRLVAALTIGDCRTRAARPGFLLLLSRLLVSGCDVAASPNMSTSRSTGDAPAELPDVV
jgi:hypothetical protein